jgi:transcriptional regulator with XRE-family HTH domain
MVVSDWTGSFGSLTARLRTATGLTQEQLAERSGLSVRAISSIECDARHPRRFTVERLGSGLGLPEPDRTALLALAARRPLPTPPSPFPLAAPFGMVGRRIELSSIAELLTGDGPGLLAFTGEPGIGKSRLLTEASDMAAGLGIPVVAGVCRRGADPYAPIVDALASHLAAPGRARDCAGLELLLPELLDGPLWTVPNGQQRRLAFAAVTRYLGGVAGCGRMLLVLDDMQWAGADAADLLTHLLRTGGGRVRVLMASRTGEVPTNGPLAAALADLARINQVHRVRVLPLPRHDAEALITAVAGERVLAAARRVRILRRAGGLPLFLIELTQSALDPAPDDVPGNLRLAIAQQVAALPEPSRLALRRMAALGRAVPLERLLDRLVGAGQPADTLVDALETSCQYGILDETRSGYRFRFPLIHELMVAGLGPHRRRLWA